MKKSSRLILGAVISLTSLSALASNDCVNELGRVKASITRQNNLLASHFENAKEHLSKASVATEALLQMSHDPNWNIGYEWIREHVRVPLSELYSLTDEFKETYPKNYGHTQKAIQKLSDCLKNIKPQ